MVNSTRPGSCVAHQRRVVAARPERATAHGPAVGAIEDDQVRLRAHPQGRLRQPEAAAVDGAPRSQRECPDRPDQAQPPESTVSSTNPEGRLERGHAGHRLTERPLHVHGACRRVIARDGIDGAVLEGRDERDGVLRCAQVAGRSACSGDMAPRHRGAARPTERRPRPTPSVGRRPGQPSWSARWCGATSQVTRRPSARADRTGSSDPAAERCAMWRCGRTSAGTSVLTWRSTATARETALTSAAGGRAAQPQDGGRQALVRLGARGQRRLVGMDDDGQAQGARLGQCRAQHRRIGARGGQVAEAHDPGRGQRAEAAPAPCPRDRP